MKSLILLLFSILGSISVFSQINYPIIDTIKGKNASYYRIQIDEYQILARNTHNVDTSRDMVYDNGEIVPGEWDLGGHLKCSKDDLIAAIQEVLTTEEWKSIENAGIGFLQIWIVADKAGDPLEMDFTFRNNDPVFPKIDADRLFQLEEKLRKILKFSISPQDSNIKRLKYFISLSYRYL